MNESSSASPSWDPSLRSDGDEYQEELQQQQQYQHQDQQQQYIAAHPDKPTPARNPIQSWFRSLSAEISSESNTPAPSLTPFRPMQPREFSLGNNLRKSHPVMPLPILPADMSGVMTNKTARTLRVNKGSVSGGTGGGDGRQTNVFSPVMNKPISSVNVNKPMSSEGIRRSSMYSRASVALSAVTMGRISEEGSSEQESSGMSSGFSASLITMENNEGEEEIISGSLSGSESSRSQQEEMDDNVAVVEEEIFGDESPGLKAISSPCLEGSVSNQLLVPDEEMKGSGVPMDTLQIPSLPLSADCVSDILPNNSNQMENVKFDLPSNLLSKTSDNEEQTSNKYVSSSGDDDGQHSRDSSSGFLSWEESRRSSEYIIQTMIESSNQELSRQLEQQQHSNANSDSNPHDHQEEYYDQGVIKSEDQYPLSQQSQQQHGTTNPDLPQSYVSKDSYESHPSQQAQQTQQSHPSQHPSPPPLKTTQSYSRSSSQGSNKSISSNSPTPFRPMLPRELLLENNLRRRYPTMPFPILPADVSRGSACAVHRRMPGKGSSGGGGGGQSASPGSSASSFIPQYTSQNCNSIFRM